MKKIFTTIIIFVFFFAYSQNTVPPVKKGNSGTMQITPDPNKQGQGKKTPISSTTTTIGNQNAVTVIIDHSGSMNGAPIDAAKNSSQILIDLIDLWGSKLFQQQIGNINFQYIQFGGSGEYNVLQPLGKISNPKQLRSMIGSSTISYGGTDFSSGIEPALSQLKGKNLNNKTIFLTDAADGGFGPKSGQNYYQDLNDTKFIIYNSPSSSVNQKGWLKAVPNGTEFHVNSEYEVLSLFVKTLFEFVDDINYYLVRQGSQNVDIGEPFKIIKHSKDKRNLLIASKPQNSNLVIEKIISPSGIAISQNDYTLYDAKTFFNIELHDTLPQGEYKIVFKNAKRSHNLFYINFERCNIYLNLATLPQLKVDECFIENSSVNFNFFYWDADLNKEIAYPDFLSHSAYRFKIDNQVFDKTGQGKTRLSFSHSFPFGSAGTYQVFTSWSYNEEKMKLYDTPPLSLIMDFCITKNGSLVHLDYDTTLTWEGRQIDFKATMLDKNQFVANNTKQLFLKTGHGTIVMKQDSINKQEYNGVLDYVKGNAQYSLALENRDSRFNFAFDKSSKTSFYGKKRQIVVTYEGKDYTFHKQKSISSFWDKIKYVFSSKNVPVKKYSFNGQNIVIPYFLPYYDEVNDNVKFYFKLNKIFPDEDVSLIFNSDSSKYTYPKNDLAVNGLWGMFSSKHDYSDAVTVDLALIDSTSFKQGGNSIQNCSISKRKGEMYFPIPLYKEPQFVTSGAVSFQINNQQRDILLDNTDIRIDITTSKINRFYVLTKWWVYKILLLILILLLLLIYGILFIVSRNKCNQKVKLWRRLKDNDLSFLQDLWSEPSKHHKCNNILELPIELKNAFTNGNSKPDKNTFIEWNNSESSTNTREIKKRFCYRSLFLTLKVPFKVFYILFLPISLLVDLFRNAFEMDKEIIKNRKFLKYVQTVENASIPNIPSEWAFSHKSRISITFNNSIEGAVRLRHISYFSTIAEITIIENYVNILALNSSINIYTTGGNMNFLTIGKQYSSNEGAESIKFIVNDEIEFNIENIDYESISCTINCHLINN
jgi:hypothetical protein